MAQPKYPERQFYKISGITGLNVSGSPSEIPDDRCQMLMNYIPIIGQILKKVPSYTSFNTSVLPANITRLFPVYVGAAGGSLTAMVIIFCADGSCWAYAIDAATLTQIFNPGTFGTPDIVQWRQERVLIIDPVAGLLQYDGTTASVVDNTQLGDYITVFQDRVVYAKRTTNTIVVSAPSAYNDYSVIDGAGSVIINDPNIKGNVTGLASTTSLIYIFAETATLIIPSITSAGGVPNIPIQLAFSSVGCKYHNSITVFENLVYTMDANGIWEINAYDVNRVSEDVDGFLPFLNNASFPPIGFVGNCYNINFYALLVSISPPGLGSVQKWLWCYYNEGWFFCNVNLDLVFASNAFEKLGKLYNFAADGTNLRNLFDPNGNTSITSEFKSKAYSFDNDELDKQAMRLGLSGRTNNNINFTGQILGDTAQGFSIGLASTGIITWINDSGGVVNFVNDQGGIINFTVAAVGDQFVQTITPGRGKSLTVDLTETSGNTFTLSKILLEYFYRSRW